MKNNHSVFVFAFFISLAFCSEDEKYSLIFGEHVIGEKYIQKHSEEISFTLPGIGYVEYVASSTSIIEFLGFEGDFLKFKATLTDVENNNIVNGIEILDQYAAAMEDKSCYLYVKSSGYDDEVHHVEPINKEDYYLHEAFEAAYMSVTPMHFRYPFDIGGVDVSKGDKWTADYDSIKFYVNMGSPSSILSSKSTRTLKKVREKRGRKIAYIKVEELLTLELRVAVNFYGEKRLMAGHATGTADGSYKWDLDSGELLKSHVDINLVGDFEMENETFHMKIFQRFTSKIMK